MKALAIFVLGAAVLTGQPRRIVSTAPGITEMLFAAGLGDRVVGVTNFCHYPPEVLKLPKVGTYLQPNLEVIAALRPDLVVIETNPVQLQAKLGRLGLKVLELNYDRIAGIYRSLGEIGVAAGVPDRAAAKVKEIRGGLEAIRASAASRPKRRILFVVGRTPGALEGMVGVGRSSYLNEVMELAGGVNVLAGAPAAYPKLSLEEILARNPEVIVDMGEMAETAGVTEERKRAVVKLWERHATLAAVKRHAVYAVASDVFVVPGPRVVDAAREFARMLGGAEGSR